MLQRWAALAVVLAGALPCFPQGEETEPLKVDEQAGKVSFGARAAKLDVYEQLKGAIEYLIVMPGGKEYEALFVAPVDAIKLREGMVKAGFKPGKAGDEDENKPPEGSKVKIMVEWKEGDKDRRESIEYFVLDVINKKAMNAGPFTFSGSKMAFDPTTETMVPAVKTTKNVVSLYHNDQTVLVQPGAFAQDPHQYKANKELALKAGTAVRIVLELVK